MKKILIIICLLLTLFACKKDVEKEDWFIELPETRRPIAEEQWAVTRYESIKLRSEPKDEAKVVKYLQQGIILEVLKRDDKLTTFNGALDYWYYVDYESQKGWIFGYYIHLYNSYQQAVKQSEKYLFDVDD